MSDATTSDGTTPGRSDDLVLDPSMIEAPRHAGPISQFTGRGEPPAGPILRSLALGAVAGMRSLTPLALLSAAAQSRDDTSETPIALALARLGPLGVLRSRAALVGCGLAALGELVADKLPVVPARISPLPLMGRVGVGAAAGAVASLAAGGSALRGARRGGAAALLASFAGYFSRTALSRRTRIPDPVWGLVEDTLAIGLGVVALLPSLYQVADGLTQRNVTGNMAANARGTTGGGPNAGSRGAGQSPSIPTVRP